MRESGKPGHQVEPPAECRGRLPPKGSSPAPSIRSSGDPSRPRWRRPLREALDRSDLLICEAPTGVGKSLAYLVPGAIWARTEGKGPARLDPHPQPPGSDPPPGPPLLKRLTDRKIEVAVLKGRGNYLCRRRWEVARDELSGTTEGEVLIRTLEAWVQLTESGDFDEAPPLLGRQRAMLARICSDRASVHPATAPRMTAASSRLSRRRAREAQVVLVNHALLVIELLHQAAGLPEADALSSTRPTTCPASPATHSPGRSLRRASGGTC